jgi:methylated-DNA-[protein]-cysteine S-methyltransferase
MIGEIIVVVEEDHVSAVYIGKEDFLKEENQEDLVYDGQNSLLTEAIEQLKEYFSGNRTEFNLPLLIDGTPFQISVWEQLRTIPFGKTRSYQDVAQAIGKEKAVRAVGQANKANRFPIIVPCHRVIGKNQTLTGYAGKKTDIKAKLLTLEGASFVDK